MRHVCKNFNFGRLKLFPLLLVIVGCSSNSDGFAPDNGSPNQPKPIVTKWNYEIDLGRQTQTDAGWTATLDTNPTAELQISANGWKAEVEND